MDTNFFLTKKALTDKIYLLFGELSEALKESEAVQNFHFPAGTDTSMGKISKGENYRELPYIILDYPRLFSNESVFAYRTMMWWGHHFSFTLHLSGKILEERKAIIQNNLNKLTGTETYISVGTAEWEHHFEEDNYRLLDEVDPTTIFNQPFLKLSRKLALKNYPQVVEFGKTTFEDFITVLGD